MRQRRAASRSPTRRRTAHCDSCARQGPKLAAGYTRMRDRRLRCVRPSAARRQFLPSRPVGRLGELPAAPRFVVRPHTGPVHRRFVERRSLGRTGAASAGGIEGGIAEVAADRLWCGRRLGSAELRWRRVVRRRSTVARCCSSAATAKPNANRGISSQVTGCSAMSLSSLSPSRTGLNSSPADGPYKRAC